MLPADAELPQHVDGVDESADAEATEDAVHEEFPVRVRRGPPDVSKAVRDQHRATGHANFRQWCAECVMGRGRANAHQQKVHDPDETAVLSWDYGFLSAKGHDMDENAEASSSGQSPVLALRDRKSESCYWYLVPVT